MSDGGVQELLNRLHADRKEVDKTDMDKLEAEIDEAVYGLFDQTPNKESSRGLS